MAKSPAPKPQLEIKQFRDEAEIDRGIAKLQRRLADVAALKPEQFNDQARKSVEQATREDILAIYGERSPQWRDHEYFTMMCAWSPDDRDNIARFAKAIPNAITMLERMISRLQEEKEHFLPPEPAAPKGDEKPTHSNSMQISIHGNVATLTLGDSVHNVTVVAFFDSLIRKIEESTQIPEEQKKSLNARLKEFANNAWVQSLGTQAVVELIRAMAGAP